MASAQPSIGRVEVLTREGRMAPARLAAFEARDPERWEIYSFEKGKLELSADYEGRLRANEKAGTSSSPSRLGTGGRRRTG